jgi:hypothetical protein
LEMKKFSYLSLFLSVFICIMIHRMLSACCTILRPVRKKFSFGLTFLSHRYAFVCIHS